MFLFKVYEGHVHKNIPVLFPLMFNAISIPGPHNVPPNLKNHYVEVKRAQVKIVSFLMALLNICANSIQPHQDIISTSIVNLLDTCPDSILIRKELLVATKHALETDFKQIFFPLIDALLKESIARKV